MGAPLFRTAQEYIGYRNGTLEVIDFYYLKGAKECRTNLILVCQCDCGKIMETTTKSISPSFNRRTCGYQCPLARPERRGPRDHSAKQKGEPAFGYLYSDYKHWAKTRGKLFNLTKEQFKQLTEQLCYYCGRGPQKTRKTGWGDAFTYNGVDRVDNSIGYEIENCVPCCCMCNMAKHTDSKADFIQWIGRIAKNGI